MTFMSRFGRRKGERGSFESTVFPHLDSLYRLAYRFTGSPEAAEDLVQDLLVKLLPQENTLATLDQPRPWLARALYNLFVDQTRRRSISPVDLCDPEESETVLGRLVDEHGESPEQFTERQWTNECLSAALGCLPPDQRAVVAWHDVEGYTLEELAESQGVPIGTLKSRLSRARSRLRELLMEPFSAAIRVGK